jgi:hypothetical protein
MEGGVQLGAVDAMTAAAADGAGVALATTDETFWEPEVTAHIDIVEYHR